MNYVFSKNKFKAKHPIIGHGHQGTVFKIDDETVLKIYNKLGRRHDTTDDLEVAKRLENLDLSYFLTPFDIRTVNGLLHSFKMKKIDFDNLKLWQMKIKDYIENLRGIRKETQKITASGIQIRDLQEHNICISNGVIRLYDFSDYFIGEDEHLEQQNNGAINDCFGNFCLSRLFVDTPLLLYDRFYSPFLRSGKKFIEKYFEEVVEDKEQTLEDFAKKLKKL